MKGIFTWRLILLLIYLLILFFFLILLNKWKNERNALHLKIVLFILIELILNFYKLFYMYRKKFCWKRNCVNFLIYWEAKFGFGRRRLKTKKKDDRHKGRGDKNN